MDDFVKCIREHALANYNMGGWDYVVEAWEDDEIKEEIKDCLTLGAAIAKMREIVNILDDRRRDIKATAF